MPVHERPYATLNQVGKKRYRISTGVSCVQCNQKRVWYRRGYLEYKMTCFVCLRCARLLLGSKLITLNDLEDLNE